MEGKVPTRYVPFPSEIHLWKAKQKLDLSFLNIKEMHSKIVNVFKGIYLETQLKSPCDVLLMKAKLIPDMPHLKIRKMQSKKFSINIYEPQSVKTILTDEVVKV